MFNIGNIVWAIATYVFLALGMYTVSKKRGIEFR